MLCYTVLLCATLWFCGLQWQSSEAVVTEGGGHPHNPHSSHPGHHNNIHHHHQSSHAGSTDLLTHSSHHATATSSVPAVPMISVSLNYDPTNYIGKLIASIDYPVRHLVVQIGNKNENITQDMVDNAQAAITNNSYVINSRIRKLATNPGSARGFNFGLQQMMELDENWVFIVNYDIEFYPGTLRRLYDSVTNTVATGNGTVDTTPPFSNKPYFGVGLTAMCCGGEWSAIVLTRSLVNEIGYFDENFYPGYFEDDDYSMRVFRSHHYAKHFPEVILQHRGLNGSWIYISGLWDNLNHLAVSKPELQESKQRWRGVHSLGEEKAKDYIYRKWGTSMNGRNERRSNNCKVIQAINNRCRVVYPHPFNNDSNPLSYWELEEDARSRMQTD